MTWAVAIARNYVDDDADGLASMIAFAALFSLMPVLIVTFLLVALVTRVAFIQSMFPAVIADDLPPNFREYIAPMVESAADNVVGLGVIAVFSILLGGGKFYGGIDRACAQIFRTPRQPFVKRTLSAIVMMPLIPALLVATTAMSLAATETLLFPVERFIAVKPASEAVIIGYLSSFALIFGLMLLAYRLIPTTPPPWRHAAVGAAVAAVLMESISQLFPIYLTFTGGFGLYESLLPFVLLVMFWLYVVGQIIVIGAEIVAYRSGRRPAQPRQIRL